MSKELQTLQTEIAALKTHNNEIMAIVNSDSPLTHKIKAMLDQPKIRTEFLALLPEVANREQILKAETQAMIFDIMQSAELQMCTPQSFLFSLKDSLSRGLRIGSAHKEAYLVKFNNKKGKDENGKEIWSNEAKIMVGYRSYINKAWNDYKIRLSPGTITTEEVQYIKKYDDAAGVLEIDIPLGKETRLHTKENISYVYITAIYPDGTRWSKMYTTESMEEKSKTSKWENKVKVRQLGKVWHEGDRVTDYKEMLHKAAIISFSKTLPERSLAELADFDHRMIESLEDITPAAKMITDQTASINAILQAQSEVIDTETGEILSSDVEISLEDRVNSMIAEIHMDREQTGTEDYKDVINSEEFKNLWSEIKSSHNKELLGKISEAMGV